MKKILCIILSTIMLYTLIVTASAKSSIDPYVLQLTREHEVYIEQITREMNAQFSASGIDLQTIQESVDALPAISTVDSGSYRSLVDISAIPYVEEIEVRAQQYYDAMMKADIDVTKIDVAVVDRQLAQLLPASRTMASAAVTYPLAAYGFYFTAEQIAQQLAILGAAACLDGPLPFGDLLALIIGVVIVSVAVYNIYLYSANIGTYMRTWYGATVYSNSAKAISDSNTIETYRKQGYQHFQVTLCNAPGGGIMSPIPLNEVSAVGCLKMNMLHYNTFSIDASLAAKIAAIAGDMRAPYLDPLHNTTGNTPLNRPHYHVNYPFGRGASHAFF